MTATTDLNPFGVDPAEEFMHAPVDVENWTEYCFLYAADQHEDYGVSLHIGRHPEAPDIFTGTLSIYLPDGEMLVAVYRGADGTPYGPGAGPLRFTCIEPFTVWLAEFDGLVQRVRRTDLVAGVLTDAPQEHARFRICFTAASPLFDLGQARPQMEVTGQSDRQASRDTSHNLTKHWQQIGRATGEIVVAGRTHPIDGHAVRDHTYGVRNYISVTGASWLNASFDDGSSFMVMGISTGNDIVKGGFLCRADRPGFELVRVEGLPPIDNTDVAPGSIARDPFADPAWRSFEIRLLTGDGTETISGRLWHGLSTTLIPPAQEVLGTDGSRETGSQMADCPARFEWDGRRGTGLIERISRISHLTTE